MSVDKVNEEAPRGLVRIADINADGVFLYDVDSSVYHNMGVHHQFGTGGFPLDLNTAFKCYTYAKTLGVPDSIHNIGFFYEFGLVVPKNLQVAFEYYELGTEKGYAPSQHALAGFYQRGRVGPINDQKAFDLYLLAANQGYYLSQCNLGLMYKNGNTVVNVDLVKAREWLTKAAQQDDEVAIKALVGL